MKIQANHKSLGTYSLKDAIKVIDERGNVELVLKPQDATQAAVFITFTKSEVAELGGEK